MISNDSGIYRICFGAAKYYVGSAKNIRKRYNIHLSDLRRGVSNCVKLQRAFNKYGENALIFEVLELCSAELRAGRESFWIEELDCIKNGYNIALDTTAPMLGRSHSEATKIVMGLKAEGNKSNLGKTFTIEHRGHLSEANIGKHGGSHNRGIVNAACKIRVEEVICIRSITGISHKRIGKIFGLSQQHVSDIRNRKKWTHL